jgi:voltage-gated sodium channel
MTFTAYLKKPFLSDSFILSIIFLNAIALFLHGYGFSPQLLATLETIDLLCTIIFVLEATVKIASWGGKKYFDDGWNRFDFILVAISLPHLISVFTGIHLQELGFLLVFRLLRVFRLIRLIKFIPDIDKIIAGALRAIKASSLIIVVFILINFIFGIITFQLFHKSSPEFFGDPMLSMYSIFKVFTIEGWFEIPDTIAEGSSFATGMLVRLFFVFVLFVGGIFGLSLVNSIFVDNMIADNNDEMEAKLDTLTKTIADLSAKLDEVNSKLK